MDWDFEWEFGPGGIARGIWRMLSGLASLFGGLILVLLFVAVAVLLIRYLLVATKAAQLYVDAHAPERPAEPTAAPAAREPVGPDAAVAEPAAPEPTTPPADATPPAKPARAPRTRTPKTPPA